MTAIRPCGAAGPQYPRAAVQRSPQPVAYVFYMPNYSDETVYNALDSIQQRHYVLPAIQREFIWDADKICALFDSLMRDYPINSLLYRKVTREHADDYRWYDFVLNYHEFDSPGCPPHENLPAEDRVAVLDGQQRLTALNIGLRGSYAKRTKHRRVGQAQTNPRKQPAAPQAAPSQPQAARRRRARGYRGEPAERGPSRHPARQSNLTVKPRR